MWNLNSVTEIKYVDGRTYRVRFDDGLEGNVDLSPYVGDGPVFGPLADPAFFRKARIEGGTIAWPNGADIAPETLYELVEKASASRRRAPRHRPTTSPRKPMRKTGRLGVRSGARYSG